MSAITIVISMNLASAVAHIHYHDRASGVAGPYTPKQQDRNRNER